jgi:predicted nucleic acid-binding protein
MQLIDTDVLIDVQRGHPPALAWFSAMTERPSISFLTVMELIQDAPNNVSVELALKLVKPLNIVYATEADQRRAVDDYRALHLAHNLGLIDALIAATAIGLGAELCTFNVKHYRRVQNLVIVEPYARKSAR